MGSSSPRSVLRHALDRLLGWQLRHPLRVLGVIAALTAVSIVLATRLRVETGFESLLPESRPSVVELRRVSARTSSQSTIFVVLEGEDPAGIRRAADALGPNAGTPTASSRSTSPAQTGASGPTTTRSAATSRASTTSWSRSMVSTADVRAIAAIPAFPGAQKTLSTEGLSARAAQSACSRPPPPTTSTRFPSPPRGGWPPTGRSGRRLIRAGSGGRR